MPVTKDNLEECDYGYEGAPLVFVGRDNIDMTDMDYGYEGAPLMVYFTTGAAPAGSIKTFNTIAWAAVKKVNTIAEASINKINTIAAN